jgi:hypothetical protein
MNLIEARSLKAAVRSAGSPGGNQCPRYAVGIELPRTVGGKYGVVAYRFEGVPFGDADQQALDKFAPVIRVEVLPRVVIPAFSSTAIADSFGTTGGAMIGTLPTAVPQLYIGDSVSHKLRGGGTLGFFADRPNGTRGIVSCNHVIALGDGAAATESIVTPGVAFGGTPVEFAKLEAYPELFTPGRKTVDAAFAAFTANHPHEPGMVNGKKLIASTVDPIVVTPVAKVGAATGFREGEVVVKEIDCFTALYGARTVYFDNVMRIESTTPRQFAVDGDSGSLVYTTTGNVAQPVGLLFYDGPYSSWMNPLADVESELKVKLITA